MGRYRSWLRDRLSVRPWWMNLLMLFCAFIVFVYAPYDLFVKPVARDHDVWMGMVFTDWVAKVGDVLHWIVYAFGLYGFWRMRPWMWPWASLYVAQMAFGMLVWSIAFIPGTRGWVAGVLSGAALAVVAAALWRARARFQNRPTLAQRYGEWALVTGASAGIGLEYVRALAARGISCVMCARREERLEELAAQLERAHGIETRVVAADLAEPGGAERLLAAVADLDIDILVSNAGAGYAGRFIRQDPNRLRQMVELNCTAHVVLCAALVPAMVSRRRGAVIVVGSVAGRQPLPFHAVYSATKGFDLLFGEGLWAEVRDQGVDVLVVQPGPVKTEFEMVAGEARKNRSAEESAANVVAVSLEALGQSPSVVTTWFNWIRANVNRLFPRSTIAFVAGDLMEAQTDTRYL